MIPFTIATNNVKYHGVTITKEVKDLYDKNFKSLKKEFKENLRRWKDLSYSCISKINRVKMAILPKAIYRSSAIRIKIPTQFFTELERAICKFISNNQKTPGELKPFSIIKELLGLSPSLTSSCTTEE